MNTLVTFLNHNQLPFIGRADEQERLFRFWRQTTESPGLRALLLMGEAGIGKSRLIEEIIPAIHRESGAVVRAKLRPGATTSILPLLAKGLWTSNIGQQLLKNPPEDNLHSVVSALQRIARLRPTLLIVEDIHLLQSETLTEFGTLLEDLADETLSVLCAARPMEIPARGVLERYLTDEVRLQGLSDGEIKQLWEGLFASKAEGMLISAIRESTHGNPLALRSALRGAVGTGAIAPDALHNNWLPTRHGEDLARELRQNVGLLAEGMAAHLTQEERRAAEQLATLGEAFARETAERLVPQSGPLLESLTFKGIVLPTNTAVTKITKTDSAFPLIAFTHSLLHKQFAETAVINADTLASVIGESLPLYSVVPFELIAKKAEEVTLEGTKLAETIDASNKICHDLLWSPDWRLGATALATAQRLLELHGDRIEQETRWELTCLITNRRFSALEDQPDTLHLRSQLADQYYALTENPTTTRRAFHRLMSIGRLVIHAYVGDIPRARQLMQEAEEIEAQFRSSEIGNAYIWLVTLAAWIAAQHYDSVMNEFAMDHLHRIESLPEYTDEQKAYARYRVGTYLIAAFETPEQFATCTELVTSLKSEEGYDPELSTTRVWYYERTGDYERVKALADLQAAELRKWGSLQNADTLNAEQLRASFALGLSTEELTVAMKELIQKVKGKDKQHSVREQLFEKLSLAGFLRGEYIWTRRMAAELDFGMDMHPFLDIQLLDALDRNADAEELRSIPAHVNSDQRRISSALRLLTELLFGEDEPVPEEVVAVVERVAAFPLVRTTELPLFDCFLTLTDRGYRTRSALTGTESHVHATLHRVAVTVLEWMFDHKLLAYLIPFLTRHRGLLSEAESAEWEQRIADLTRASKPVADTPAAGEAKRLKVTMLGTIGVVFTDGTSQKMRGSLQRSLLGALTAREMMREDIEPQEFYRLVASGDQNPDHARKYMNNAVKRTRDILGQETIVTEDRIPRLNHEIVEVDLLSLHTHLRNAEKAQRNNTLAAAAAETVAALEISNGDVPFPTLYDEFFENLREDIETRLRKLVISVSRALHRERDLENAERVLRTAYAITPDDEELAEMYVDVLNEMNKSAEAEQVMRKMRRVAMAD